MDNTTGVLTVEFIRNCVYTIRGQQVMLDSDLADIYGYELKAMNQQVKRNIERFPEDFMFQLTKEEFENLKSQFVTSSWGGIRKMPYVFTEQGIYMLATVLKGSLATQQSIFIMRAFKEMRHYIRQNQQFVTQSEMSMVTAKVSELSVQMAGAIDYQKKTDKAIEDIQKSIDTLNENFVSDKDFKNFIIYKGQKFEADAAYIDIYQQAAKSIYVVDDYMNTKSLQLLSQKNPGVEVILFTENGHGKRGFLTTSVVNDFIKQYPPLRIKPNPDCHDRLIVLDYGLPTEQAFHCGASSKDAGKKLCAINKVESVNMVRPVIDGLLKLPDKNI
ncbi:ORF6N domain-containing protein [Butyrivibrio sp. TB]|uniref:ORF6N domain-containing protein n=1 Tax=Butyrivibrio sp. TB TaxID=1520809 RepID=UPI0008B2AFE3|nr:ORF6N domain-containing protein [Butyrivibrio sp. TB]SEQ42775.1 ORF6N domain-containing protein [Butyrivibrio sp. TB]